MSTHTRLLVTADAVGGVWQYATTLAEALAPRGYEVTLALLGPATRPAQREQVAAMPGVTLVETGLPLDWLADDAAEVRRTAAAIARLAAETGADLVQLNQPALAVARAAVPTVAVAHSCVETWWRAAGTGPAPESFAWQTALVGEGLRAADAVICPSRAFADAVTHAYRLASPPQVVHNGRAPLTARSVALHDFAFTAGRLWDDGKNAATLDCAAARLGIPVKAAGALTSPQGDTAHFEHLHTLGPVDERGIAECLAARPVYVSAARYEPFGLAVLEAALAGCSLVLSDIPTHRELWGEVALFVDPGDANGFARAIETLVGDMSLRLARGDLAHRHAQRFTPAAMADGVDAIYRRLLPARRAAA